MHHHIMKHWQSTDHHITIACAVKAPRQRTFSGRMLKYVTSLTCFQDPHSLSWKHPRVHVQANSIRDDYAQYLRGGNEPQSCTDRI